MPEGTVQWFFTRRRGSIDALLAVSYVVSESSWESLGLVAGIMELAQGLCIKKVSAAARDVLA